MLLQVIKSDWYCLLHFPYISISFPAPYSILWWLVSIKNLYSAICRPISVPYHQMRPAQTFHSSCHSLAHNFSGFYLAKIFGLSASLTLCMRKVKPEGSTSLLNVRASRGWNNLNKISWFSSVLFPWHYSNSQNGFRVFHLYFQPYFPILSLFSSPRESPAPDNPFPNCPGNVCLIVFHLVDAPSFFFAFHSFGIFACRSLELTPVPPFSEPRLHPLFVSLTNTWRSQATSLSCRWVTADSLTFPRRFYFPGWYVRFLFHL